MIEIIASFIVANPSVNVIRSDFCFKPFSMNRKARQIWLVNGIDQLLLIMPFARRVRYLP